MKMKRIGYIVICLLFAFVVFAGVRSAFADTQFMPMVRVGGATSTPIIDSLPGGYRDTKTPTDAPWSGPYENGRSKSALNYPTPTFPPPEGDANVTYGQSVLDASFVWDVNQGWHALFGMNYTYQNWIPFCRDAWWEECYWNSPDPYHRGQWGVVYIIDWNTDKTAVRVQIHLRKQNELGSPTHGQHWEILVDQWLTVGQSVQRAGYLQEGVENRWPTVTLSSAGHIDLDGYAFDVQYPQFGYWVWWGVYGVYNPPNDSSYTPLNGFHRYEAMIPALCNECVSIDSGQWYPTPAPGTPTATITPTRTVTRTPTRTPTVTPTPTGTLSIYP